MNIIINGGSGGIGREVVLQMANNKNNQIIFTGRDEERLKEIAALCTNKNASYLRFDLSVLGNEAEAVREQVFNRISKLDIMINCAGSLVVMDFMDIPDQDARIMMETNLFGPATFIKMLVPLMAKGSHIVNISSMGGFQGSAKYKGLAYYSASKAALACLTECLAVELADRGISANCLALGSVQTEMFENAFPGFKAPIQPAEMAAFISYFAVNGNKFFNGKILPVAVSNP
jgi:NAD(P)-dependent dehydrogenase (short-subunit alcohol dehydrogenase family)